MSWQITTPYFNNETNPVAIGGLIFDSVRNGDVSVELRAKFYPKSDVATTSYTIPDTQDKIAFRRRGCYWQYHVTGEALGQSWRSGQWFQEIKQSGRK